MSHAPAEAPDARVTAVRTWVFDLDNTLYPPEARLFDQVNARITAHVMRALGVAAAEAEALRARYWREHGTTLAGLMAHHGIDPEAYLEDVHEIDLSPLSPDPALAAAIARLPGRKIVYTNGSRGHGRRITAALGLSFDAIYGVEDAGFAPKPRREAFERVFAADGLDASGAAMVEDDQRNLRAPVEMGMVAIWRPARPDEAPEPHVHFIARDLAAFLSAVG